MKKIAYIIIIVTLAMVPIGVLAGDLPTIDLVKTANPTTLPEPGGAFQFTLTITNNLGVVVTITDLNDTQSGATDFSDCEDLIGTTLAVGASTSCTYSVTHTQAGRYDNTAEVIVEDSQKNTARDSDDATVTVREVPPVIEVIKTANPDQVSEQGGMVTFTVVVENQSNPSDPVTITSLVDDIHGDLDGQGTCSVPQTIQPDDSYTCTFTAEVSGIAGYPETDTVTASGADDEGTQVSDSDFATVTFVPSPLYKLYIPILSRDSSLLPCIQGFNATVGFEDLPITGPNDYDFNDWITDIRGNLDYTGSPTCDLRRISLTFNPQARGATYEHAFHMLFPANTFLVDGTATLTVYDHNGGIISSEQSPFDASVDNDFTIFSRTSNVFPAITNTVEGKPIIPPGRTATLTIEFVAPAPFKIPTDTFNAPHGENLFFDPYLFVINWGGSIHRGDFRLLNVPVATYLWPEETRPIYDVYSEGVQFIPGNPPTFNFIADWWNSLYNDCIFGDGIKCSLP